MYIYNVTINIEEADHNDWLEWMRNTHIPDMLATGKFTEARMCRVMVEEEMGGITYSVQYTAKDRETLQSYYQDDAARLRQDAKDRFGNRFVAFRTELDLVSLQNTESLAATEYLFTYGTLQSPGVQAAIFERQLDGIKDILCGYKLSEEKMAGAYPVIESTGDPEDLVEGTVYVLTPGELAKADRYEGVAYKRIKVKLSSGKESWVYIAA